MISEEKQYEYLGRVLTDRLNRIFDSFKLFLQLFSTIVGGSIWLSMQNVSPNARHRYIVASDTLILLVILVTGVMVFEAQRGWWGYRKTLSEFDGGNHPIPPPKWTRRWTEIVMLLGMVASGVVFALFNPFAVSSN